MLHQVALRRAGTWLASCEFCRWHGQHAFSLLCEPYTKGRLHAERQKEDPENAAPVDSAQQPQETKVQCAVKSQADLSRYYVDTEGTLLGEFGSFLGQLADRIDEKVAKQPA